MTQTKRWRTMHPYIVRITFSTRSKHVRMRVSAFSDALRAEAANDLGPHVFDHAYFLEISTPPRTTQSQMREFVARNQGWIAQQTSQAMDNLPTRYARASADDRAVLKKLVSALVPGLIEKWSAVLDVHPAKIDYRAMKSRWGSCQPTTGRVCINTLLALYPPECLEYVVVHELCHLREANHGPAFWGLVESCLPNYREIQAKLK